MAKPIDSKDIKALFTSIAERRRTNGDLEGAKRAERSRAAISYGCRCVRGYCTHTGEYLG